MCPPLRDFDAHKTEFCKFKRWSKRHVVWEPNCKQWICLGCGKTWPFSDTPEFEKEVEIVRRYA